ncbi:MAG: ATP-binding protein [Planctomycetaceae bacterium]|nr:ATP-binding protein [Planctomycetaceae bacterium]
MLISFSVKNWRSFRDQQSINLVASAEKQHLNRVPEIAECKLRILPTAAIYGGNASGKSNLFKAFRFAQDMVVNGPSGKTRILVEPFRLDSVSPTVPTEFEFVFLVEDEEGQSSPYAYEFSLSQDRVLKEQLSWIKKSRDIVLFEREDGKPPVFHKILAKDKNLIAVLENTRNNQLFLTNAASQNTSNYQSKQILHILGWFNRLTCISPNTSAIFTPQAITGNTDPENNLLYQLGTGIFRFDFIDENLPQHEIKNWLDDRSEEYLPAFIKHPSGSRFVIDKNENGLQMKRMVSVHRNDLGQDVRFDLTDTSDGTVRLLDLLPCFQDAARPGSKKIFFIDEIDRSMHTLLVRRLLEGFLELCSPQSRSQILFTTHDIFQMDQELLRRDEMWLTERRRDGSTELIPLSSFKEIRSDKSIRTSYLRGQLGGVPKLTLSTLRPSEFQE